MRKLILLYTLLLLCTLSLASEKEALRYSFKYKGETREYLMYIPENLPAGAPLVMVPHSYKNNAAKTSLKGFSEVADRHGFAVCYPDGSIDAKGNTGFNVGYPSQLEVNVDDIGFICALKDHVVKKFKLSKVNHFCTGMSNGGDVCYSLALERPDAFVAYAPIAGLAFNQAYKNFRPAKVTPFFEIHGTADKTSMWEGDPTGAGGWGEYISVPLAIQQWATFNRCTHEVTFELPLLEGGHKVIAHRYVGGDALWKGGPAAEVWLYEVVGAKHSWHQDSLDTCEEIWQFFARWLR